MTEPQQTDIVTEARELAPYVHGIVDATANGRLSRVPELLHQLADEVERSRAQTNNCRTCGNPMSVYCPRCVKELP